MRPEFTIEGLDVNILANIIGNLTTISPEAKNSIRDLFELTNNTPFQIDNTNFIRG
ncbi:hypothetical protein VIBC2010_00879 [Vibrio caribbeanicus ATCC BAA-2122]|uniref:Uncharacterized protein n=1 Tax=Vibrio caribbeanicus ATCC BAA-2122 TaxID=796620 RepID=E3BGJ7_9VIBR|nr:hypothetical protein VIBC2010_00879 [Vibrio caribbeanicus ATCC BAA-2122]